MSRLPTSARGFTLIELVIAIVIISISVTGLMLAYATTVRGSADPMIVQQAVAIAEAYLEEIQGKSFANLGSPAGRANYEDIDDYNGLNDAGAVDAMGVPVSGLEGYQVRVTIDSASNDLGLGAGNERRISVRVTFGDMVDYTLVGYRANYE